MTDKTDSKEREAFEAWALSQKLGEHTDQIGFRFHDVGDGYPSWRAWQARASLTPSGFTAADMATASAQGFRDGVASLAANAGSEPVALNPRHIRKFLQALQAGEMSVSRAVEILDAWIGGYYSDDMVPPPPADSCLIADDEFPMEIVRKLRAEIATHPSPPEGMAGGWISVKERLPPPFEEVVVYPRPDDYCCEAFCDTAGNWKWAEYEHNFGVHHRGCQVEYWLMLPEVPAPPTSSADSRKGE